MQNLSGILLAVVTALSYGLYPAAAKAAYADGANPVFMILLTTFWRMASLTTFCVATQRQIFQTKERIKEAVVNGFFQAGSIIGVFGALAFIPGATVIVIMYSYVFLLYFFLVFKKQAIFSYAVLLCVMAGFFGLTLVANPLLVLSDGAIFGVGFALWAAIAIATRMYRYGEILKQSDPAEIGAETFVMALIFCLPFVFYQTPAMPVTLQGWYWSALASASFVIATFTMFYGIKKIGSFDFAFYVKLEPAFALIFSYVLINEILVPSQYVGILIVVLSLIAYQRTEKKLQKRA